MPFLENRHPRRSRRSRGSQAVPRPAAGPHLDALHQFPTAGHGHGPLEQAGYNNKLDPTTKLDTKFTTKFTKLDTTTCTKMVMRGCGDREGHLSPVQAKCRVASILSKKTIVSQPKMAWWVPKYQIQNIKISNTKQIPISKKNLSSPHNNTQTHNNTLNKQTHETRTYKHKTRKQKSHIL